MPAGSRGQALTADMLQASPTVRQTPAWGRSIHAAQKLGQGLRKWREVPSGEGRHGPRGRRILTRSQPNCAGRTGAHRPHTGHRRDTACGVTGANTVEISPPPPGPWSEQRATRRFCLKVAHPFLTSQINA